MSFEPNEAAASFPRCKQIQSLYPLKTCCDEDYEQGFAGQKKWRRGGARHFFLALFVFVCSRPWLFCFVCLYNKTECSLTTGTSYFCKYYSEPCPAALFRCARRKPWSSRGVLSSITLQVCRQALCVFLSEPLLIHRSGF